MKATVKTELEPPIACGGERGQGPDADGNDLIFTVGAYRERRNSTNEGLINDQPHAALRCIDLITPPSCLRHSTSSSLMAVHSGISAWSHGGR